MDDVEVDADHCGQHGHGPGVAVPLAAQAGAEGYRFEDDEATVDHARVEPGIADGVMGGQVTQGTKADEKGNDEDESEQPVGQPVETLYVLVGG